MRHAVPFRRPGSLLLLSLLWMAGRSQTGTPIPDSLTNNAVMAVRSSQLEIEILSPRRAKMHRHYVYTILNSRGDRYADVYTFYDKFHDLVSATGILYDAEGRQVKKIKKGDMEDWNTGGSGILMTDMRVKIYSFGYRTYPYTISYDEETEINGLFMLPEWQPQPARNVAVGQSSLLVRAPSGFPLRYKNYDYPGTTTVSEEKGVKTYTWQVSNRPALPEEQLEPDWSRLGTHVRLVPGDFEIQGYKGTLREWNDIGKFVNYLYQGRDQLPPEARAKVHQLTDGLTDDRQKIAVLYRYLQHNTHYVGIELGIGGWQPFDANYVYTKRYGDCKALSNYMVALLKEAGVRASSVLIRGGNVPALDTGFACAQFNHAIAVAFVGKDSVWLECTSQTLAPGYLGSFTSDRDALLVDAAGAHIVHTPAYGVRDNRFVRFVKGAISVDGDLEASLVCDYSGLEQDLLQWRIDELTRKDLIRARVEEMGIPNEKINDWSYSTDSSAVPAIPSIRETMTLSAGRFATVSGNRLIFTPGYFFKRMTGVKDETHARPFELPRSSQEEDSLVLQLPPGYQLEGMPFNASFSCPCGSYRIHSSFTGGTLTISCYFRQNKGLYDATAWPRLARFFNLVHREGDRQIVFVKQ